MAVDLAGKSIDALKTILRNHEVAGKTGAPSFKAALAELGKRTTAGLTLDGTLGMIVAAAREGVFISYKTIALQSGVKPSNLNVSMPKHLLAVCEYGHRKGLPMISSIVVSQSHVADGGMDPATLEGFCKCAATLNYVVEDPEAFLKEQQAAVFKAAQDGRMP
jgi:hypothetical protein